MHRGQRAELEVGNGWNLLKICSGRLLNRFIAQRVWGSLLWLTLLNAPSLRGASSEQPGFPARAGGWGCGPRRLISEGCVCLLVGFFWELICFPFLLMRTWEQIYFLRSCLWFYHPRLPLRLWEQSRLPPLLAAAQGVPVFWHLEPHCNWYSVKLALNSWNLKHLSILLLSAFYWFCFRLVVLLILLNCFKMEEYGENWKIKYS